MPEILGTPLYFWEDITMPVSMTPEQMTEYMAEIQERVRIVNIDEDIYVLKYPTELIMNDGRIMYARILSELLKQQVPSRAEMRNLLITSITAAGKDPTILDKRQALMQKLADSLQETVSQDVVAKAATNVVDFMGIVDRAMGKLSNEDRQLMAQAADVEELELGLMGNCAEALAATHRDLYILARCVYTAYGKPFWANLDAIQAEQNLALLSDLSDEFQRYLSGLPLVYEVVLPAPQDIAANKEYPTQPLS